MRRLIIVLGLVCFCAPLQAQNIESLFRTWRPVGTDQPPVLLEKTWGKEIETREQIKERDEEGILVGSFEISEQAAPVSLLYGYVGIEKFLPERPTDNNGKFFFWFRCPEEKNARCGDEYYLQGSKKEVRLETNGSFTKHKARISGSRQTVHVLDGKLSLPFKPGVKVEFFVSRLSVPQQLDTHYFRLKLIGGDITFEPPPRTLAYIGKTGRHTVTGALIAMGIFWLLGLLRPAPADALFPPPRLSGSLIFIWGVLFASVAMLMAQDVLLFYPVVGTCIALSGVLLARGSRFGQWCYALALILAVGITVHDLGASFSKESFMRLGMLCLVALHVFSPRISHALDPES